MQAGTTAPPFELYDAEGDAIAADELLTIPTILLFVEPNCVPCHNVLAGLIGVGERVDGAPLVVVIDDSAERRALALPAGLKVMSQRKHAVSDAFRSRTTPQAFVVDVGRVILDRRSPSSLADLRIMAWFQREGGDSADIFANDRPVPQNV